jgi:hypothetical protein
VNNPLKHRLRLQSVSSSPLKHRLRLQSANSQLRHRLHLQQANSKLEFKAYQEFTSMTTPEMVAISLMAFLVCLVYTLMVPEKALELGNPLRNHLLLQSANSQLRNRLLRLQPANSQQKQGLRLLHSI